MMASPSPLSLAPTTSLGPPRCVPTFRQRISGSPLGMNALHLPLKMKTPRPLSVGMMVMTRKLAYIWSRCQICLLIWQTRQGDLYGIPWRVPPSSPQRQSPQTTTHTRLLHTLYGLKQAGLGWWKVLNEFMQELSFKQLKTDAGLFLYRKGK